VDVTFQESFGATRGEDPSPHQLPDQVDRSTTMGWCRMLRKMTKPILKAH
jgi:hypothetical protein